ncbi:AfsR/SARP family transcriptional regulator [Streptomyces boncukensis]|uniref:AfsR/SARP family transcriptional regulator n=1 Tax=Streptomyces boncukensis TaxID=2711219 RepID=A0A6G4WP42_9ACTN|nr:AfsR/SARP family transcriptional regulator [Streptomyces boncukensis]NGO66858.1 AfsR/SARP family transcriptional regulator [Streptomyces boncukensis]
MLLLNANRVVPRECLINAVWGAQSPPTSRSQVHICISQLRHKLAEALHDGHGIETQPYGYVLHIEPGDLDVEVFRQKTAAADLAQDRGRLEQAVELYRAAVALWRGPALSDLESEVLRGAAAQLDEERIAADEKRIELELRLGRHRALVHELTGLVVRHPLNELLNGYLMTALYRSGRQADALASYQRTRSRLAEELGLEPGRELRALERAILRHDDSLVADGDVPCRSWDGQHGRP